MERDALEERYQRKLAETQMAALRSQMNPHFLFNSLNSIKDFIITNNPEDAVNHLQKFSELIRAILENSKEREISLAKELETVKLYADLEALRCGGKFRLNIEIVPDINPDLVTVPPMIIQPYVENAIWHGLLPKEGKGLIQIRCSIVDSMLTIVIEDNGIGRIEAQKRKESSVVKRKSVGMSITRERIKLSDTDQSSSGLKVEDLKDDQGRPAGTRITIYWKYQIDQSQHEAAQGNNNRR
jgi:LytS/YehU family sensor histidine kinase